MELGHKPLVSAFRKNSQMAKPPCFIPHKEPKLSTGKSYKLPKLLKKDNVDEALNGFSTSSFTKNEFQIDEGRTGFAPAFIPHESFNRNSNVPASIPNEFQNQQNTNLNVSASIPKESMNRNPNGLQNSNLNASNEFQHLNYSPSPSEFLLVR